MQFEDFYKVRRNAERYERERFSSVGGREVDRVEQEAVFSFISSLKASGRVMDLGCGTGRITSELVRRGFRRVVGIDVSDAMLAEAKKHVKGAEFIRSSMFSLPELGTFDACVSVRVIHHLRYADMKRAFIQIRRVLKDGAVFVFDTNRAFSPNAVTKLANLSGRLSYNQFTCDKTVMKLLMDCGFSVQMVERRFLIPSFMLNASGPLAARAAGINRLLERRLPLLCASTFWKARAAK